jgi:hypothetical protein
MLRKLTATATAVLTGSLALASSAFARLSVEVGSSSGASSTTGGGTPWGNIAIGVVLAAAVAASVAAVVLFSRSRRGATAVSA